jgi:uncharacterized protein (UPF0261 family)
VTSRVEVTGVEAHINDAAFAQAVVAAFEGCARGTPGA